MAEINPVLVKELRGQMRGVRSFVLLSVFIGLLGAATLLFYTIIASESQGDLNAGRQVGQALFLMVAFTSLVGVSLITPTLTAGSLAGERERQTFDLLVVSQLSPWQIVLGKLGSALAYAFLIILAIVPLMSLAFLFGGVSLAEVLIALVCMAGTALLYATIGLFWSGVMRTTLSASSLGIGTVVVKLLGIPFIALLAAISSSFSSELWSGSVPTAVLSRLFLSFHPFFALALTEEALQSDRGIFLVETQLNNGITIYLPSPWVMFIGLVVVATGVLLLLTVRSLRRGRTERPGRNRRPTESEG